MSVVLQGSGRVCGLLGDRRDIHVHSERSKRCGDHTKLFQDLPILVMVKPSFEVLFLDIRVFFLTGWVLFRHQSMLQEKQLSRTLTAVCVIVGRLCFFKLEK